MGPATANGSTSNTYPQMSSGSTGSLQIGVPSDAQPGDYAVFTIHSFETDAQCRQFAGSDLYHAAVVGVYVR